MYKSFRVLFNLLNKLKNRDKMRGLPSILSFIATSLINSHFWSKNFNMLQPFTHN